MSTTYSISDLARELDITTRTIRFYEEQGMLNPERRGQERIYSARDKVSLKLILRGKRIGFSLAECRELIELYDPSGNHKQLETFMRKIAERREQLRYRADAAGTRHRRRALSGSHGRSQRLTFEPAGALARLAYNNN